MQATSLNEAANTEWVDMLLTKGFAAREAGVRPLRKQQVDNYALGTQHAAEHDNAQTYQIGSDFSITLRPPGTDQPAAWDGWSTTANRTSARNGSDKDSYVYMLQRMNGAEWMGTPSGWDGTKQGHTAYGAFVDSTRYNVDEADGSKTALPEDTVVMATDLTSVTPFTRWNYYSVKHFLQNQDGGDEDLDHHCYQFTNMNNMDIAVDGSAFGTGGGSVSDPSGIISGNKGYSACMAVVDCTDTDRKEGVKLVDWAGVRSCPDTHAPGYDAEMSDYENSLIPVGTRCTCTVISTPRLPAGSSNDSSGNGTLHTGDFVTQTQYYVKENGLYTYSQGSETAVSVPYYTFTVDAPTWSGSTAQWTTGGAEVKYNESSTPLRAMWTNSCSVRFTVHHGTAHAPSSATGEFIPREWMRFGLRAGKDYTLETLKVGDPIRFTAGTYLGHAAVTEVCDVTGFGLGTFQAFKAKKWGIEPAEAVHQAPKFFYFPGHYDANGPCERDWISIVRGDHAHYCEQPPGQYSAQSPITTNIFPVGTEFTCTKLDLKYKDTGEPATTMTLFKVGTVYVVTETNVDDPLYYKYKLAVKDTDAPGHTKDDLWKWNLVGWPDDGRPWWGQYNDYVKFSVKPAEAPDGVLAPLEARPKDTAEFPTVLNLDTYYRSVLEIRLVEYAVPSGFDIVVLKLPGLEDKCRGWCLSNPTVAGEVATEASAHVEHFDGAFAVISNMAGSLLADHSVPAFTQTETLVMDETPDPSVYTVQSITRGRAEYPIVHRIAPTERGFARVVLGTNPSMSKYTACQNTGEHLTQLRVKAEERYYDTVDEVFKWRNVPHMHVRLQLLVDHTD